ncbi:hypothetical protein [Allocoleopsis franciscana]|uniref:Uncharacterized protein n=1 Tax=Allocoleopsis franciscana PCC 7113 TaxID=1173027 RepID=K9WJJ1_9CYAN|nr:hypothetical protein [Allocoleopsis franciscana]AFZ19986.1 hypothetical protein Mic7113_4287 [Allocoleopsis franciscana PCC 7113]
MRRNFSPENDFAHRLGISYIKVSRQNHQNFDTKVSLRRIYPRKFGSHPSTTISSRLKPLKEEVPEIIKQLHSFQPICCSNHQHKLAQKALISLRNRQPEDMKTLAKTLADDIAGAVD